MVVYFTAIQVTRLRSRKLRPHKSGLATHAQYLSLRIMSHTNEDSPINKNPERNLVIVVTGASRGIGLQVTAQLLSMGHNVVAIARTQDSLERLGSRYPERLSIKPTDLSKPNAIGQLANELLDDGVSIAGLVNNAGVLVNKPFLESDERDWDVQLRLNVMAPALLTRALVPMMIRGAHVLNVSSMGGYQGSSKFPGLSAYSASKGALAILTESLAVELAGHDIASNCLCLGAVQTEMLEQAFPGIQVPVTAEQMGRYIADFVCHGHELYNGRILPVALSDPE